MIQIELSEEMQAFVDRQVQEGEFADAAEYLTRLVRAEQKRIAKEELELAIQEGFDSGDSFVPTDPMWNDLRTRAYRKSRAS